MANEVNRPIKSSCGRWEWLSSYPVERWMSVEMQNEWPAIKPEDIGKIKAGMTLAEIEADARARSCGIA